MSDDDATERDLRAAADLLDPPPAHLLLQAVAAFAWRTIDAELAELVFDSLAEPVAGMRGADQPRLLTFRADEQVIELELGSEGATRRVVGRVSPAGPAEVAVQHGGGRATVDADEWGRFAVGGLAPGPLRVRCRPAGGGPAVVTDWFSA
jgi:hypothetical protein